MCRYACLLCVYVFFFKQKTAYEMRISDWSSDVCSSDLRRLDVRVDRVRLDEPRSPVVHVADAEQQFRRRVLPERETADGLLAQFARLLVERRVERLVVDVVGGRPAGAVYGNRDGQRDDSGGRGAVADGGEHTLHEGVVEFDVLVVPRTEERS